MKYQIGPQYNLDDKFKASARAHQSRYRAEVLKVDFDEYGNRLIESDAKKRLNYYDKLNVRELLGDRFKGYSKSRDADLLRSQHIPFNMFGPLVGNLELAAKTFRRVLELDIAKIEGIQFEYAPALKSQYLNDATAFDTYVQYVNTRGEPAGIGIEVKYTEKEYPIGKTEKERVDNPDSSYWKVTEQSKAFSNPRDKALGEDALRQIWRNHLLGLAMVQAGDIKQFTSVTLHPKGNQHFCDVIPQYQNRLKPAFRDSVRGVTFEDFIEAIDGDPAILAWKQFLRARYLVKG